MREEEEEAEVKPEKKKKVEAKPVVQDEAHNDSGSVKE